MILYCMRTLIRHSRINHMNSHWKIGDTSVYNGYVFYTLSTHRGPYSIVYSWNRPNVKTQCWLFTYDKSTSVRIQYECKGAVFTKTEIEMR